MPPAGRVIVSDIGKPRLAAEQLVHQERVRRHILVAHEVAGKRITGISLGERGHIRPGEQRVRHRHILPGWREGPGEWCFARTRRHPALRLVRLLFCRRHELQLRLPLLAISLRALRQLLGQRALALLIPAIVEVAHRGLPAMGMRFALKALALTAPPSLARTTGCAPSGAATAARCRWRSRPSPAGSPASAGIAASPPAAAARPRCCRRSSAGCRAAAALAAAPAAYFARAAACASRTAAAAGSGSATLAHPFHWTVPGIA